VLKHKLVVKMWALPLIFFEDLDHSHHLIMNGLLT